MFFALTFSAAISFVSAQKCTISGAADGGSVEVMGCSHSGNAVIVTVANDSQEPAKVFIEVAVTTSKSHNYTAKTSYPVWVAGNTPSQEIRIEITDLKTGETIETEKVLSISGSKCAQ